MSCIRHEFTSSFKPRKRRSDAKNETRERINWNKQQLLETVSMALFEPSPIGNTDGHTHFVEIRAGKMYRQGTWVYPDKRKGTLYIYRNSDDLMHFCWRDRSTFALEDDFIIFPGDCTYSRVRECKTGRVYVLRFESSTVRMFYWLQEPKMDKDDEHCRRINYLLNHPPNRHTTPSPFNITQAQLSRIFGPEVAAQLSAIMTNEENSRFDESRRREANTKHDTTPISGVDSASGVKEKKDLENKKRSNLKPDSSEKKQTKNVTIVEDGGQDGIKKKNEKNKGEVSVTDVDVIEDYIDSGDEDEESGGQDDESDADHKEEE